MSDDRDRSDAPLIERARIRALFEERKREFTEHPERAKIVVRSTVRILHDMRKEARVGPFTFMSDEHAPLGGGSAPPPLHYFVAAVGL